MKAYCLYDPSTKRVHVSRDVIFDGDARWSWEADVARSVALSSDFIVEFMVSQVHLPAVDRPTLARRNTGSRTTCTKSSGGQCDTQNAEQRIYQGDRLLHGTTK